MSNKFKFKLGDKVEDLITGFCGIVNSRSQWLHNCNTYGLKSQDLKDGAPIEMQWFDEPQLKFLKKQIIRSKRDTGGPTIAVKRMNR